jgi:hypothetical protein
MKLRLTSPIMWIVMGISLLAIQSCGKRTQVIKMFYSYDSPKVYFTYQQGVNMNLLNPNQQELTLYTGKFKIPMDSILRLINVPKGEIESATLTKFKMVMTDPKDSTFDWVSYAHIVGSVDSTFASPVYLTSLDKIDLINKTIDFIPGRSYLPIDSILSKDNSFYLRFLITPSTPVPSYPMKMYLNYEINLFIRPLPD